jgi:hypothetical protein
MENGYSMKVFNLSNTMYIFHIQFDSIVCVLNIWKAELFIIVTVISQIKVNPTQSAKK